MFRVGLLLSLASSACTLSISSPGLEVSAIEPAQGFAQADREIVLRGAFAAKVKVDFQTPEASQRDERFEVRLERDGNGVDLQAVRLVDATTLAARVPAGIAPGPWDVRVTGPWGKDVLVPGSFEIINCLQVRCELPDGTLVEPEEQDEVAVPPPVLCGDLTFADADGDGRGAAGTGAMLCGPGRAALAGDCDDADRDTAPGAAERCNGVDDDCDGVVDEGVCPVMNPNWVRRLDTGGPGRDWRSVAAFGGGAWIAGGDELSLRTGAGGFAPANTGCPRGLEAVWASSAGEAFVGGGDDDRGQIAFRSLGGTSCQPSVKLDERVLALVGFEGAGVVGLLDDGATFQWTPPASPVRGATISGSARVHDLHGSSPTELFAAGSNKQGRSMRLYRYDASRRRWARESLSRLNLPAGALRAVWSLSRTSVFAVGDDGVALEKTSSGWRRLPSPGPFELTAVRAFNPSRVYVTTGDGRVLRWNGRAWQTLYRAPSGAAFTDLGGVTESDLWAVGEKGLVVHWPE